MRTACVPVCNYFTSDNRVRRTCDFLEKNGFDVHVLAVGRADLPEHEELTPRIHVHRYRAAANTNKTIRRGVNVTAVRAFQKYVTGAVSWVRRNKPEVIHYNDWNTLFIGPLSGRKHRAIYDMHELFQDLSYLNFPRPINQTIAAVDRAGLNLAEAVICVSKPIQRELQTITRKPVYVVRNMPETKFVDGPGNAEKVAHLTDGRKHLVFLGALLRETGALYMPKLLRHLPDDFVLDCFSMRAPKNQFFIDEVARMGVTQRVFIHDYLPHAELCATVKHGYAGMSCIVPVSRKYEYALPNKLFEYFLSGLPVITSGVRAQAELVEDAQAGLVVDLDDPAASARRIAAWKPARVTRAQIEEHGLTWEHEEKKLLAVYRDLQIL